MTCGARTRSGGRCGRPAGWGTDHAGWGRCKLHGGASPNGTKNAQRLRAVDAVASYGLPQEIDPHQALMDELWRTHGHVLWLGREVARLERQQLYGPVGGGKESIPGVEPHIWIRMYQAERKHLESVAKTCIACGIAEREIRLAEQQGEQIAAILQGVLTDLGVNDHPEAPAVVRKHLTLMAGGAA